MTLREFIDEFYLSLLKNDWKLNEIDQMDIIYYLQLMKLQISKSASDEKMYIDEIL